MVSFWPTRMKSGFWMLFQAWIWPTVTPKRSAMPLRTSPGATV